MSKIPAYTLKFTLAFALFIIGPALLGSQFPPYNLMKIGDIFDLLTPIVLIPMYWGLFTLAGSSQPGKKEIFIFLVIAAAWVQGQGMHLAANSIGHLLNGQEGTALNQLTYFYDEILSHYLWHLGMVGFVILILYRQWKVPFAGEFQALGLTVFAGMLHGFNYFLTFVEGGTTALGIPVAIGVTLFGFINRKKFKKQPLLVFFFAAFITTALFILGWGIYWGGLPEFSDVGLL